ncbi:MAG: N-acetylmuramoyl-L-alanine amidase [Gammaproteobacteria bacterium]
MRFSIDMRFIMVFIKKYNKYIKIILYIILNINIYNCNAKIINNNYTQIKSLRIWPAPEGTRVVFDLSQKIDYKIQKLSNPHRIVIDFKNAKLSNKLAADILQNINNNINNSNNINKIRTGINQNALRIVLELNNYVDFNSFVLKPNEHYGHRLVLDLEYKEKHKILALFDLDEKPNINNIASNLNTTSKLNYNSNSKIITANKRLIIAIDAGHGGEDPGAIGPRGTLEKDIVLSIARILKERINQYPNMRAFLIRQGDYYISLSDRMLRARLHKADLFLSLQADAFYDPKANGASVFILSEQGASSAAANWLANSQNRSDTIGGVKIQNKQDLLLTSVLLDLSQTANYAISMQAAKSILLSMQNTVTLHKYQVEHANFAVLKAPDVPSVLIETGFISNPKTELKLRNSYYQTKIVHSIIKGINNYFALQSKKKVLVN